MASLNLKVIFFPQLLFNNPKNSKSRSYNKPGIVCGLRKFGPRTRMGRSRVLSRETIQAVQSLKLAKSPDNLANVFDTRITRLLKADLTDTLFELQRQNEVHLALEVFNFMRKEADFESESFLYSSMMSTLGRNNMCELAEQIFFELMNRGFNLDTNIYTEMIGVYFRADMPDKALDMYESMKLAGCIPNELTFTILIRNLELAGRNESVVAVKRDCAKYMDYPKQFIEEIEKSYPKRRPIRVV